MLLFKKTRHSSPSKSFWIIDGVFWLRVIKSITAKRIFAEHSEVKKKLWGVEFWSNGYFVSTEGKFTSERVIKEYVKNQEKEKDYMNFPKGESVVLERYFRGVYWWRYVSFFLKHYDAIILTVVSYTTLRDAPFFFCFFYRNKSHFVFLVIGN